MSSRPEYADAILQIRTIAEVFADKISSTMPEYTDHSVAHLDALWTGTDQVLTGKEEELLSASECFVLGAAYYIHDLGMALPATPDGRAQIENAEAYKAALARFKKLFPNDTAHASELALREATREVHAKGAFLLATQPIPGLGRYVIENSDLRNRWAHMIAEIAESHHWNLEDVEHRLGPRQSAPGPDGEPIDLAYIACVLRVVDYSHINQQRASYLERLLRPHLSSGSLLHWEAQSYITGPIRQDDRLVYGCTQPIRNIDAWWLFHDIAVGLDAEIKSVHDYLKHRSVSAKRFSLIGVKGVEDPAVFNRYVHLPAEVVPIDIRVQPDSMERVVELLGGRHIYGGDRLAPVRELIQNSRDALELRLALDRAHQRTGPPPEILVSAETNGSGTVLIVKDNGVGMTRAVVRKYLVGVGADFWGSVDFYREFRDAMDAGFHPVGRFGIGFLSVFMLGDRIEVDTEVAGGNLVRLRLNGLGRRGELSETHGTGNVGTEIRVFLKSDAAKWVRNLPAVVVARAPMLSIPIRVKTISEQPTETVIEPGWWRTASQTELFNFIANWRDIAYYGSTDVDSNESKRYRTFHRHDALHGQFGGQWSVKGWPASKPEYLDSSKRLISSGGEPSVGVVECSEGIAIRAVHVPDVSGLIDLGPVDLTVSRESTTQYESDASDQHGNDARLKETLLSAIRPAVIAEMDRIGPFGMLPGRTEFIRGIASVYGPEVLERTKLRWIPLTEAPGDLRHCSITELEEALRQHGRIVLCTGLSAGGVYSLAERHIPARDLASLPLIAIRKEEVHVDYEVRDRLKHTEGRTSFEGGLDYLLELAEEDGDQLVLTNFFISCIAKAWDKSAESIREQEWHLDCEAQVLWAEIKQAG